MLALQSGDIQLMSDAIPGAIGPVKTGKAIAIGIADQRRERGAKRRGRLGRATRTPAPGATHEL